MTPLNQPSELIDAELILAPMSSMSRSIGCWTESNDESNGLHKTRFPERVVFEFRIPNISKLFKLIQIDHIISYWMPNLKWVAEMAQASFPDPAHWGPYQSPRAWHGELPQDVAAVAWATWKSCQKGKDALWYIMIYHIYASFKLAFIHVYPTSLWFNMFRSSVQDLQDIL